MCTGNEAWAERIRRLRRLGIRRGRSSENGRAEEVVERQLRRVLAAEAPLCYTVRVRGERRRAFMKALAADGIETAILYPPNHRQPAFARFARPRPVTERIAREHVSLPLFAGMSDAQVDHVIDRVAAHSQRHDLSA